MLLNSVIGWQYFATAWTLGHGGRGVSCTTSCEIAWILKPVALHAPCHPYPPLLFLQRLQRWQKWTQVVSFQIKPVSQRFLPPVLGQTRCEWTHLNTSPHLHLDPLLLHYIPVLSPCTMSHSAQRLLNPLLHYLSLTLKMSECLLMWVDYPYPMTTPHSNQAPHNSQQLFPWSWWQPIFALRISPC